MIPNTFGVIPSFAQLLTLALVVSLTFGNDKFGHEEVRDIEKFAGDVMGCANIPGLALGVVRRDETFTTGLGVADMVTAHPVDKRTIFNLGSTAKAFVPYILAEIMNGKENHDGRITWNSTLRDILSHDLDPEVPSPWADLALKDMLIYKSGSSAADMSTMAGLPEDMKREEVLRRLRFIPNNSEFRDSNHYSNIMYAVAGHLAERMSGMSWEELVKARLLDKLNMTSSAFAPDGLSREDAALPYRFHVARIADPFVEQNRSLFDLHPSEPIGSLMTSAEDMTKWLRHILHNLHVKVNDSGVNMLIEDAFLQWVPVPGDQLEGLVTHGSEVALGYGMGWFASTYRGERRYRYRGTLYAYNSQIWVYPDSRSAVFVAMNGPGNEHAQRALETIMFHLSDIALHKMNWVDSDTACCCQDTDYAYPDYYEYEEELAPAEQKQINYRIPVVTYVGTYGNGLVGNAIIEANRAGVLTMTLGRNLEGELLPDISEFKLKFQATGWLHNTEEWATEKMVEFVYSGAHSEAGERVFSIVKIHVKDMVYEFKRDQLFEGLLQHAEEEDRLEKERTEAAKTTTSDGSGYDDTSENGANAKKVFITSASPMSESHESKPRPGQSKAVDTESHQNHQPYNIEGQRDEPTPGLGDSQQKVPDAGRKVRDKNEATSKDDNSSSTFQPCSILLFLTGLLSLFLTKT